MTHCGPCADHRSIESFPKTYLISFHTWGATFSFQALQNGESVKVNVIVLLSDITIRLSSVKHCTDVLKASVKIKHSHRLLLSLIAEISKFTVIKSDILTFSPFGPGLPCNKANKSVNQRPSNEHANKKYIHNYFRGNISGYSTLRPSNPGRPCKPASPFVLDREKSDLETML